MGMGVFGGMGWFTELVVGAEDADVFFLVAEEDVDLFYGCVISRSWGCWVWFTYCQPCQEASPRSRKLVVGDRAGGFAEGAALVLRRGHLVHVVVVVLRCKHLRTLSARQSCGTLPHILRSQLTN